VFTINKAVVGNIRKVNQHLFFIRPIVSDFFSDKIFIFTKIRKDEKNILLRNSRITQFSNECAGY